MEHRTILTLGRDIGAPSRKTQRPSMPARGSAHTMLEGQSPLHRSTREPRLHKRDVGSSSATMSRNAPQPPASGNKRPVCQSTTATRDMESTGPNSVIPPPPFSNRLGIIPSLASTDSTLRQSNALSESSGTTRDAELRAHQGTTYSGRARDSMLLHFNAPPLHHNAPPLVYRESLERSTDRGRRGTTRGHHFLNSAPSLPTLLLWQSAAPGSPLHVPLHPNEVDDPLAPAPRPCRDMRPSSSRGRSRSGARRDHCHGGTNPSRAGPRWRRGR